MAKDAFPTIYLDHHATTPIDESVVEAMVRMMREHYANPGSSTHHPGRAVGQIVDESIAAIAAHVGAASDEIIITSGATESCNLAIFGTCLHPRQKKRKVISLATEHRAVLDPLQRLSQFHNFQVEFVPIVPNEHAQAGRVDLNALEQLIDGDTALVTVMLANNEVGVIQSLATISDLCRRHGCLLHTDATQAVGRIPVNVDELGVDLLTFSAHKFYGPKGIGALFVRRRDRSVRLLPQIVGGGQQHNFRSGTLNAVGIVGMRVALDQVIPTMVHDDIQQARLRQRLWTGIQALPVDVTLNGPSFDVHADEEPIRLAGNLNATFYPIEGQSLMLELPRLAVSSGSACESVDPAPSHVLIALGLSEAQARSSLRFGLGRGTTVDEIDVTVEWLSEAVEKLCKLL